MKLSPCLYLSLVIASAASNNCDVCDIEVSYNGAPSTVLLSRHGLYGSHSPRTPASGLLRAASIDGNNASNGCNLTEYDMLKHIGKAPWIALVRRGECSFGVKIQNAIVNGGASAVIVYNRPGDSNISMMHNGIAATAVLVPSNVGSLLVASLNQNQNVRVAIRRSALEGSEHDSIVAAIIGCCSAIAVGLNGFTIVKLGRSRERRSKPHAHFTMNLLVTDLLVGVTSAFLLALLYEPLHDPCAASDAVGTPGEPEAAASRSGVFCTAFVLMKVWDVLLYSNLFSVLLITADRFAACRWPLIHKRFATRRKADALVALSWAIACALPASSLIAQLHRGSTSSTSWNGHDEPVTSTMTTPIVAAGQPEQASTLCGFGPRPGRRGTESWTYNALAAAIICSVLLALLIAYGYIVVFLCRLDQRMRQQRSVAPHRKLNLLRQSASTGAAGRGRKALATSGLLVLSFVLSYSTLLYAHLRAAFSAGSADEADFIAELTEEVMKRLRVGPLVVDLLLNGLVGAFLDPLIYSCRRKREGCVSRRNSAGTLTELWSLKLQRTSSVSQAALSTTM